MIQQVRCLFDLCDACLGVMLNVRFAAGICQPVRSLLEICHFRDFP